MRLVAIIACALACACGSKQDSSATKCAEAAQQGIDAMVARAKERIASSQLPEQVRVRMDERTKKLEELAPRLRAVVTNRCVDDKWKAEVIGCYAKVTSMEEMRACRAMLPPEHQAKLQKEELDLMAGAMGPPGFGSAAVATSPDVQKLEAELRAMNAKLNEAVKANAPEVKELQQQMQEINDKLAAARAQAQQGLQPQPQPSPQP